MRPVLSELLPLNECSQDSSSQSPVNLKRPILCNFSPASGRVAAGAAEGAPREGRPLAGGAEVDAEAAGQAAQELHHAQHKEHVRREM